MTERVVIDTSVFVAALIGQAGPNREILRRCLTGHYKPLLGNALICEYEDVIHRRDILARCPVSLDEIESLLDAFCSVADWVSVYYLLRPNLRDEGDNHLVELAAAGNARRIITNNVRDLIHAELLDPGISITTPEQLLQED